MKSSGTFLGVSLLLFMGGGVIIPPAEAGDIHAMNPGKANVVKHWTKERMANAIPRDLVIDSRGLGYMRRPDGSFVPYGHQVAAGRGGNSGSSDELSFTVDTGGSSGGGSGGGSDRDTVVNAPWDGDGAVQTAAGRIYFEMPGNARRKGPWDGYVCSGTVVQDGVTGRSVILTAAHCVYDDVNKAFARNVLFIPNQDGTNGSGTDTNCSNDPLGCWTPSFGVVDKDWAETTFPNNVQWDYAYYVVSDTGAHAGTAVSSDVLDFVAGALPVSFLGVSVDDGFTHALGYSYSDDPNFMYCVEEMTTERTANIGYTNWWLPSCGLSDGSSGGPWVLPMDTETGSGPVISVNSWGYTYSLGMAGPKLTSGSSTADCLFVIATSRPFESVPTSDGDAGIKQSCPWAGDGQRKSSGTVLGVSSPLFMGESVIIPPAEAGDIHAMDPGKANVVKHWTKERMANAIPRDLVIDSRGLGYMRRLDGSFVPYGHQVAAERPAPLKKRRDSTPPVITDMDPAQGATIGDSHSFSAVVTDESGVKWVSFILRYPSGDTQSFNPTEGDNDTWSMTLGGFTDGSWSWWAQARDATRIGGNKNKGRSDELSFTVDTGGSSGGGSGGGSDPDTVVNAPWDGDGAVQTAAGRIYFEMPSNARRKGPWVGHVCSGTVVQDGVTGRSVILTAAHCVYDDVYRAFARNVLFIPNQDGTNGSGTDTNCSNDPLGCWTPSFGVVDKDWAETTFPSNSPWDYAYYVVSDTGAHAGTAVSSDVLDFVAGALPVSFLGVSVDDGFTHALGYSYSDDPNFMYCVEEMTTEGTASINYTYWWLPSCGLSDGSSGGPWVLPMDTETGSGPVISVNSWGYTYSPGLAGPKLTSGSSTADCLFVIATSRPFESVPTSDGDAGIKQSCP